MEEKEIVIPDLDDDDEDYALPAFSRPFGNNNGSSSSLPDAHSFGHHSQPSTDSFKQGGPSTTPKRPGFKQSSSFSIASPGFGGDERVERPRLGKFSNGSSSSIQTTGTSFGSTPGFMASRKGSLASLKNAFKSGGNGPVSPVPPVPTLDAAGYPTLKNPFSRFDGPASPADIYHSPQGRNVSSPSTSYDYNRKFSTATNHSSHLSQGGRSVASQGSSNWRPEDHPMPSLPPIPMRQTPSRLGGRRGSENGSLYAMGRRNGSIGGGEETFDKTPGEEALRVVYKNFKDAANAKVTKICGRPLNTQPSLPAYLEQGLDPSFDAATTAFAHCARRHARRVVELLSLWCKSQCEGVAAQEVRAHLNQSIGLQMRVEEAAAILSARKSSTAKYIYNRTLIELVKSMGKETIPEDIGLSLENTAFSAYRTEKLEDTAQFPHRKAVSQLQIDLLGELSSTRFLTVSDRFIRELAKHATSAPSKENDARIEHLLRGMQHLKLRVYPETELEASADFLQSLSSLYANANGQSLKAAYAETFLHLLHPVVETATAEVNHPIWSKAIAIALNRAQTMASKSRYWSIAFPLVVTALAVSPREIFMQSWQNTIDTTLAHFKDRATRAVALNAFLRLLWVYLNRCGESATSTRKRIDQLLRNIFLTSGVLNPPELPLEPFVLILHYAMTRQLDYGEELLVEFLRGMSGAPGDVALYDRATALIRALAMTLKAIEQDRPAPWPSSPDFTKFSSSDTDALGDNLREDLANRQDVLDSMSKAAPAISTMLTNCDRSIGSLLLSSDAITLSANSSSQAIENLELITRKHGDVFVTYPAKHDALFRLQTTLLDAIPRCLGNEANFAQIANVLSRATFSADPAVCVAACAAMRRTAQDPERCEALVRTYRDFIFDTRHVFRDTFIGSRLLESQFERVVKLWLDLLQTLVGHSRAPADDGERLFVDKALVDRCEGSGLILLCSSSVTLRRLAGQILAATRDLDGADRRPSAAFRYSRIMPEKASLTRSIQLYEGSWDASDVAAMRSLPWINTSDRQRFDTATSNHKTKLLQSIAESDQPRDAALWLAILPFFITRVHEQLPASASELRITTIAMVLRLQGHVASVAQVIRNGRGPSRTSSDPSVLADHWRSYLCVLCVTMPTTSPTPATPPVQRTKEAVILTPDTIGTPALFHYQCALLAWDDPRFRDAAVFSLGTTSAALLRPLCEVLLGNVRRMADGTKLGTPGTGNLTSKRPTSQGSLWTAIAHVFRLISPLLLDTRSQAHFHNLSSTISFVKVTFSLLSDRQVKEDFDLQSLRRSFCVVVENLTNALAKLDSSDRFFGEEIRGAVFKLCYEWCHVGRRPDVAKARESQTLQAASENYKGERDRAQYLDDLQAKTKLLSVAASEAMAGLCQGKLISTDEATPAQQASEHMVEPLSVLRWIRGMFSSSAVNHHETGRKALFALIKHNWSCARLLDEVLHQSFGEGEHFSLECSFFGVVADVLAEGHLQLPVEQVACLSLSKLGHPVADVRLRAFQLVCLLLQQTSSLADVAPLLPSVGSTAANIYRVAQKQVSERLADIHADYAKAFLGECATRLSQLEAPRRLATLSILPAWLAYLDLSDVNDDHAAEYLALSNLMYLAIRFSDDHLSEIKEIFLAIAGQDGSRNMTLLVKFLFEQGGKRKSPDFVLHAKRIMACLAQSPAGDIIFDEICAFIEPGAMAVVTDAEIPASPMTSLANLDALMSAPSAGAQAYSTGQLALLFAGELLPYRLQDPSLPHRLPALLHSAIVHCDHAGPALRDQAQAVLFQVLRGWIYTGTRSNTSHWTSGESKLAALVKDRSEVFWKSEDDGGAELAFYAPAKMTSFVLKILAILLPFQPDVQRSWGNLALSWATSCPIRHLACRSFQIFRVLSPAPTPRIVSDTLARLSSTIASPSSEVHVFNAEVLRTFACIVQKLSPSECLQYPQIFWCAVACLSTPFESEFAEVIDLLSNVLDKTNLSDPGVVQKLMSFRPADWAGPPPQLQSMLLIGLRSSKTAMMTFDLIRRLSSVQSDELIDAPDKRLLHGFLAALPWMLQSNDTGEVNQDLSMMALDLAAIADTTNSASFSRLLTSFARSRFRAKDDFIRQAASILRDFMASYALDIVTILLAFVLNSEDWMRVKSMQILALILQSPDARAPLITHGTELLQPLLRLVSTKHSAQALDILDMPVTSAASAESLTTSMMATGDIFGSISSSGWSVPRAKEAASMTRENVTAVFNTCAQETRAASVHFSAVQFSDIKAFNNPSQTSFDQLPSPTAGLQMSTENASMGDLVGALHSLGQFFDDGIDGPSGSRGRSHGRLPSESTNDRRVRAIISRGRQPSITSPIYENHPYITPPIRSRHQYTTSELTDTSISSAEMEMDATERPGVSSSFASTFVSDHERGGTEQTIRPGLPNHRTQDSMSSSIASDFDRSENLFALEEAGNESMTSVSMTQSYEDISQQSTPVMMKRTAMMGVANG